MNISKGRLLSSAALVGVVILVLSPIILEEFKYSGHEGGIPPLGSGGVEVNVATVEPSTARARTLMATVEPQTLTVEEGGEAIQSRPEAAGYNLLYETATITLTAVTTTANTTVSTEMTSAR